MIWPVLIVLADLGLSMLERWPVARRHGPFAVVDLDHSCRSPPCQPGECHRAGSRVARTGFARLAAHVEAGGNRGRFSGMDRSACPKGPRRGIEFSPGDRAFAHRTLARPARLSLIDIGRGRARCGCRLALEGRCCRIAAVRRRNGPPVWRRAFGRALAGIDAELRQHAAKCGRGL